jgi:hypothetical protein
MKALKKYVLSAGIGHIYLHQTRHMVPQMVRD